MNNYFRERNLLTLRRLQEMRVMRKLGYRVFAPLQILTPLLLTTYPASAAQEYATDSASISLVGFIILLIMPALFGSRKQGNTVPISIAGNSADGSAGNGTAQQSTSDASSAPSDSQFEQLFDHLPVSAIHCDAQGQVIAWNPASTQLYEKELKDVLHQPVWQVLETVKRDHVKRQVQSVLEGRLVADTEVEVKQADNTTRYILFHCYPLEDPENGAITAICISLDHTTRKKSEHTLRLAQESYQNLIVNSPQGVFRMTPEGIISEVNAALARLFGLEKSHELLAALNEAGALKNGFFANPERYDELMRLLQEKDAVTEFDVQVALRDQSPLWVEINAQVVRNNAGEITHIEGTIEDVSKRKAAEEKLLRDALHDKLTGLPNRALFMERLGRSLARSRRLQDYQFAVLFVDLDRFKIVNDSLGHVAGDQLLQTTSRKLEACLRPGDTVARMGGDEFAILLENIENLDSATQVAERIQTRLSMPLRINGQEIFTTASIGIVRGTANYEEPEDLLRDSDMAMYKAKQTGKAHHEVFDVSMMAKSNTQLQLETDLRRAVQRNEFALEYQPIVSLVSGRIAGFEALVRWRHPEQGTISPGQFVPLAEETGLILPIGRWALREACRQLAAWHQMPHGKTHPLTMAVNLSTRQFAQPDLVRYTEGVLRQAKIDPRYFKLEITESVIMANVEAATAMLLQFKELGIRLSIDDFGTGYSSLAYLQKFPISSLKIDRSFVSRMDVSDESEQIVRTIVDLAHNLKMDVIAEGVETEEQLAHLRALEAQYGQGYYFAGPMDGQTAAAFISAQPQW